MAHRKGDAPVILLDNNHANLIVGRQIVCTVERQHLREAVLAYLGLYYLLDLDYPASLGFTLLQYIFFQDQKRLGIWSKLLILLCWNLRNLRKATNKD